MVTITPRAGKSFAVEFNPGPAFLVLTLPQINAFLRELQDTGMIRVNGQVADRPRR